MKVLVLNGPNLNLLGTREPKLYGSTTLEDVTSALDERAAALGCELVHVQSNSEGALVDAVQQARGQVGGALVNAGGYTHTSVALRDALLACEVPFIEVHVTNPHAREPFRHKSYLSDVATGIVVGFGWRSYLLGLEGLAAHLAAARP